MIYVLFYIITSRKSLHTYTKYTRILFFNIIQSKLPSTISFLSCLLCTYVQVVSIYSTCACPSPDFLTFTQTTPSSSWNYPPQKQVYQNLSILQDPIWSYLLPQSPKISPVKTDFPSVNFCNTLCPYFGTYWCALRGIYKCLSSQ